MSENTHWAHSSINYRYLEAVQTPNQAKSAFKVAAGNSDVCIGRSGYYLYKVMSGQTSLLQAKQSLEHLGKAG
jgi:hypothetical protein